MSYLIQISESDPGSTRPVPGAFKPTPSACAAGVRQDPGEANSAGLFCHLARAPLRTEERPPNSGVTMTDFRDLAKQARTVHEVRLAKDESRHLAKSEAMASASDHLRSQVLPLLETAQAQFKEEGVAAHIMAEPRHGTSLMRFQLVTPPRASDALQQPMSAVLFESDGSSIAVGVDGSSRTLGKCPPGDISTLVNEALLKALATYYSKWEGLQQRWR